MASKSLSVLVVLAAFVAVGHSQKQLFAGVKPEIVTETASGNMDKLKQDVGPLTNMQVYGLLKGMADELKNKAAKEYVVMARVTLAKCSEEKLQATDEACKATQTASVKRYCEYCQAQQVAYCQKNRQEAAKNHYKKKQADIFHSISNYVDKHSLLDPVEDRVCEYMNMADRVKMINDCESLLRTVEKEGAFVSSVSDDSAIDLCKYVSQSCTKTMF